MGLRGPTPTPTAILAARGSNRVKGRQHEAKPPRTAPPCPAHLSEAARFEWERMVDLLLPAGLLTSIDGDQLSLYCVAYSRWVAAERQIAEDGIVVKSPNGYPMQHPCLSIANKAMEQMHKYLAKFGCNPSDRARAQVAPITKDDRGKGRFFLANHPEMKIG